VWRVWRWRWAEEGGGRRPRWGAAGNGMDAVELAIVRRATRSAGCEAWLTAECAKARDACGTDGSGRRLGAVAFERSPARLCSTAASGAESALDRADVERIQGVVEFASHPRVEVEVFAPPGTTSSACAGDHPAFEALCMKSQPDGFFMRQHVALMTDSRLLRARTVAMLSAFTLQLELVTVIVLGCGRWVLAVAQCEARVRQTSLYLFGAPVDLRTLTSREPLAKLVVDAQKVSPLTASARVERCSVASAKSDTRTIVSLLSSAHSDQFLVRAEGQTTCISARRKEFSIWYFEKASVSVHSFPPIPAPGVLESRSIDTADESAHCEDTLRSVDLSAGLTFDARMQSCANVGRERILHDEKSPNELIHYDDFVPALFPSKTEDERSSSTNRSTDRSVGQTSLSLSERSVGLDRAMSVGRVQPSLDEGRHASQRSRGSSAWHECSVCRRTFQRRTNLLRHMVTVHENKKLFQCERCGQAFGTRSNLIRHDQARHQKLRPLLCPEPACGARFTQMSDLARHRRRKHPSTSVATLQLTLQQPHQS